MEVEGKTILVLGLGRTGRECARFLVQQRAKVRVSDLRPEHEFKGERESLAHLPIDFLLGGEDPSWLQGVDCVVTSPGVPRENSLLQAASERRIPVLSEVELAYRFLHVPLIAITGTNGKSTTTMLVGEMLKANETRAFVGGNIGVPLIGFVSGDWEWGVVEISSFQLEWVEKFRPRVAVLLNMTEDHLDRYADFTDYCRAKEEIFAAQTGEDVAILNRGDPAVWRLRDRVRARVISFGFDEVKEGVFGSSGAIIWCDGSGEEGFTLGGVKIQGVHNLENIMAAIAVAKSVGVPKAAIQKTIETFPGLEHRLEFVREINRVRYFNDSKGTNVGAVVKSLASFSAPVILLAGGVDKGGDYRVLQDGIKKRVRRLVLFGAAKEKIADALGHLTKTVIVDNMQTAVRDAAENAQEGDVVLLSPACSSFDMFRDYAERGRVFKKLVHEL